MAQHLAVDFEQGVEDAFSSVAAFVPRLVSFLVILVIGFFVAKALQKIVNTLLERVGFDRAVERGGVKQALSRSKYDASDILAKLVYYAVLLFALQMAFAVFGPNPVSGLIASVIAFLPKVFVAIVIVVIAAAIAKAVKDLITGALGGLSYGNILGNVASAFILGIGIIAALNQIEVATTVTTPLLVAVLATIGGILVVGVGGGLIRPMSQRLESVLNKAESGSQTVRDQVRSASSRSASPYPTEPGSATGGARSAGSGVGSPSVPGSYRQSGEDVTQQFRS